ncbi:hypothetical protein HZB88_01550, partial [archaeon]|nr:hypothetical protein [archaeon]
GEIEKQRAIAKELAIAETEYQSREPAIASKNLEIGLLKNEVTLLEKENLCIKEGLQQLINKKAVMLKSHEENMFAFRDKIQHIKTLVHEAGNLKSKISTLDRCPTCEQPVTAEYKKKIADSADAKITLFEKDGLDFNEKLACSQGIVDALRQEIKGLEREQAEQEVILLKIKAKEEKKGLLEKNGKLIESLTKEKSELEHRIAQLKKEEEHFARTEHEYKNKKEAYESVCFRQREAELKAGILKANIKNIEDMLSLLKREIKDKKNAESKMQGLAKLQSWLESGFSGLIEAIEISIMGKIHAGFNSMFQNWFRKLIEDENISVNIDETFTPRVTISLHDIDYDYLSGGERTAVALAYRLALNQAINEIITSINTREILILDEPTEGFSSAQIDSMKDIFKAINVKQLIIVSHEPRLESFVDDVIRFEKAENRTRVYY